MAIIEPLQEQWQLVKGEVEHLLGKGDSRIAPAKRKKAEKILQEFLHYSQTILAIEFD
jgi:hypothetical protein